MVSSTVRVLAVEDNPADLRLLKEQLWDASPTGFEIVGAGSIQDAMHLVSTGDFDVVLLDLNLPDSRGLDGIGRITSVLNAPPVIVLTGMDDEGVGLRALARDAQDYLVKGKISGEVLVRSIRYSIQRALAEQALRQLNAELEHRVKERTRELEEEIAEREEVERQLRIQTTAMEAAANGILITDRHGTIEWVNPALTGISGFNAEELVGRSTRVFSSGIQDRGFYADLWTTILAGGVWRGEMTNRRRDGALRIEEQTITPVRDEDGRVHHFIAIKQDITERKQAELELEQRNVELQLLSRAEHEQRQLSDALVDAALVLNKSLKLDEVLAHILEQVRNVIPYELANVALLEQDAFYDASHRGDLPWPAQLSGRENRLPLDQFPLLKRMIRTGEPVILPETRKQEDWLGFKGLEWVRSFLSAPLLVDQKVIGFVSLFAQESGFFTPEMTHSLAGFAAQAAVAIQNAWLFEQVQASAERLQSLSRRLVEVQENERLYIPGRELHDEAGQLLTSLLVDLQLLEKRASQPDAIRKIVEEMERSIDTVLASLHRIAMALRPASLDHVGLVSALRQHVESVGEKHGLTIRFKADELPARLPENLESVLYRVAQEALTNVVRHAQASSVDIVLMRRDRELVLIVEDDGLGFDPSSVDNGKRLGLFGMRERTDMIGGKLTIESSPGKGTIIMVEVGNDDSTAGG